ncbi:hypothetical protein HNR46_001074 [Haloferula luteola]|uniref:SGNH hydrolase-type esterase domain-containing protein n=1 Tax=Haloferula luteola TaxID=595692 RepID=A0A840VA67_9BACT|nr:hypothetical protein [Haloferula luteola]MBB5350840.1 hypothetical protein [Haloferula luteola]
MKNWRGIKVAAFVSCVLGIGGAFLVEVAVRASGITSTVIYDTDKEIGYIPKGDQDGKFSNKAEWHVNSRNMSCSQEWFPNGEKDLLLVGDSIVWGGNPIDQSEKLGDLLQGDFPSWKIWPISAGSWSVENPQIWMDRNPDILGEVDALIWIVNSGDLYTATQWESELTHPRSMPMWRSWYAYKRYVYPRIFPKKKSPLKQLTSDKPILPEVAERWGRRIEKIDKPTLVVFYPNRSELGERSNYEKFVSVSKRFLPNNAKVFELAGIDGWNESCYRDEIHPSVSGYRKLEELISERIRLNGIAE